MRPELSFSTIALTFAVAAACAREHSPGQSSGTDRLQVAGTWDTQSYVEPDDSAVASVTTVSADGKT